MNPQIVNPQTGTEILPVTPQPIDSAVPHASIDMRFDLESIVAIGVDEILAAMDEAKRKVASQLEATTKFLSEKRRELADALAEYGCPDLRADVDALCISLQTLGESARVNYEVGEPNRKAHTYAVTARLVLLRNSQLNFSREQDMQDEHVAILNDIQNGETKHGKLSAALAELSRRSNEASVTRKARAAAAKHVYSQNEAGKGLVNSITNSVPTVDKILAELLPELD